MKKRQTLCDSHAHTPTLVWGQAHWRLYWEREGKLEIGLVPECSVLYCQKHAAITMTSCFAFSSDICLI